MKSDEAFFEIVREAKRLALQLPGAVWYGFGSYFKGQEETPFSDIDVLIVCLTAPDVIVAREITQELCTRWPLHLVIMTKDEQAETGFVESEGCILLHAC